VAVGLGLEEIVNHEDVVALLHHLRHEIMKPSAVRGAVKCSSTPFLQEIPAAVKLAVAVAAWPLVLKSTWPSLDAALVLVSGSWRR
jgi:hypothetical protein